MARSKKFKYHEYKVRNIFREAGFKCERVPCSGASGGFKGDVVIYLNENTFIQGDVAYRSKKRAYPKLLFSKLNDCIIFITDYNTYLMDISIFLRILKKEIQIYYNKKVELGRLNKVLLDKIERYDFGIFRTHSVTNIGIKEEKLKNILRRI